MVGMAEQKWLCQERYVDADVDEYVDDDADVDVGAAIDADVGSMTKLCR